MEWFVNRDRSFLFFAVATGIRIKARQGEMGFFLRNLVGTPLQPSVSCYWRAAHNGTLRFSEVPVANLVLTLSMMLSSGTVGF